MTARLLDHGSRSRPDVVERPRLVWWVFVLGGLTVLGFQGFSTDFYSWWVLHVNWLPGKRTMAGVFIACVPIHVVEAIYVHRLALRLGMHESAVGWSVQTLLLGYPSTRLIRNRARKDA
jgi:hypothetical protein